MSNKQSPNISLCQDVASNCIGGNLRRATRAVNAVYDDAFRPLGLLASQFSLLIPIHLHGPIAISQLAELTVMDRTTLTRNLKPLVNQGWIQVDTGQDRRLRMIRITVKGRSLLSKALLLWEQTQQQLLQQLGAARWNTLRRGLQALVVTTRD